MSNSKNLLRTNAKLDKSAGRAAEYSIAGLTLAPHRLARIAREQVDAATVAEWKRFRATRSALDHTTGMVNVCRWAGHCTAACNLWFSGQRVTSTARNCAIRDTRWLFLDPAGFHAQLHRNIEAHQRAALRDGLRPLVRLNVASDLDWSEVIEAHRGVTFYDYTKSKARMFDYLAGKLPGNYHLTYSYSERTHYQTVGAILRRGGNVAAVVDTPYHPQSGKYGALPATMTLGGVEARVIDGDKHDVCLPELDGRGVVRGLRLKGTNAAKSRARATGFALPMVDA